MNARADLYAALMAGGPHSPERSEKASALIDAFRADVLAEVDRLRAELGAEKSAHRFTLRQRNNRSNRLLHLRNLANSAASGDALSVQALIEAARDTLAASQDDHQACGSGGAS